MRDLTTRIQTNQAPAKSIMNMTPFEIWEADEWQKRNRGFEDNDQEDFENYFGGEEE